MKANYLLPKAFLKIGWCLFIPGIILGGFILFSGMEVGSEYFSFRPFAVADGFFMDDTTFFSFTDSENNFLDEIATLLIIFGAVFIAFSKRKNEDEFITKIRLESLMWATYINYGILILATVFVFGMSFFWVLVFNMFTILVFFIIRFNWAMAKANKLQEDEKQY